MGAEKQADPHRHDRDNTHLVQATDGLGRTVARDAYATREAAEARAAALRAEGHAVEVSRLEPNAAG